jgi:hypothetical protein
MMENKLKEIIVTKILFKGTPFEIQKGETIYYRNGLYSENWQSWTIDIFKKIDGNYKFYRKVTESEFSREIQYMRDNEKAIKDLKKTQYDSNINNNSSQV